MERQGGEVMKRTKERRNNSQNLLSVLFLRGDLSSPAHFQCVPLNCVREDGFDPKEGENETEGWYTRKSDPNNDDGEEKSICEGGEEGRMAAEVY